MEAVCGDDLLLHDFQRVIAELGVQDNRLHIEYNKLLSALRKSHESESRLVKRCQELNQEIIAIASRLQYVKVVHDNNEIVCQLRAEIEKAWTMVDRAYDKEHNMKAVIQNLQREVAALSRGVDQRTGTSDPGEASEVQRLEGELRTCREEVAQLRMRVASYEAQHDGPEVVPSVSCPPTLRLERTVVDGDEEFVMVQYADATPPSTLLHAHKTE
jgi:uncharacterized protein YhaN